MLAQSTVARRQAQSKSLASDRLAQGQLRAADLLEGGWFESLCPLTVVVCKLSSSALPLALRSLVNGDVDAIVATTTTSAALATIARGSHVVDCGAACGHCLYDLTWVCLLAS